jgi:hypothetical protein
VSLTRWERAEERTGTFDAKFFAGTFHHNGRNTKGLGNLALRGTAVGDELAGEKSKRCDIIDWLGEDGKMTVEVITSLGSFRFLATSEEVEGGWLRVHGLLVGETPTLLESDWSVAAPYSRICAST